VVPVDGADLCPWMPERQRRALVTEALGVQLQEVSMQIHARAKMCSYTLASVGPPEQACRPDAQDFAHPLQGQPISQRFGQYHRTLDSGVLQAKLL
jgi:hypothetical protein